MRVASWMTLAAIMCFSLPAFAQYGQQPANPPGGEYGDTNPGAAGGGAPMPGGGDVGDLGDLMPGIGQSDEPIMSAEHHDRFADRVDVSPVRRLAVFHGGRAKILDTLARETVQNIHGRSRYQRPAGDPQYSVGDDGEIRVERDREIRSRRYDPVFTFLDLVLNGDYYVERPLLHVPHVELRQAIVTPLAEDEAERVLREGRVAARLLFHPEVQQVLEPFQRDTIRNTQLNRVLFAAQNYIEAGNTLMVVSPRPGDDRWPHLRELAGEQPPGDGTARSGEEALMELAGYGVSENVQLNGEAVETFRELARAWRQGDAATVNANLEQLAEILPQIHPETYTAGWKRGLEYIYNVTNHFTYSYLAYFAAFVALMLAFAAGWNKALLIGGGFLAFAFVGHTFGMFTRIALSDRWWTIHNQYESFFMLTWFAALAGLALLIVKRQWIYGAAAAGISAVTLLVANQAPIPSSEIGPQPAILATSNILYVHVNIMIIAYALIALALILSLFYLFIWYSSGDGAGKGGDGNGPGGGTAAKEGEPDTGGGALKLAAAGLEPTGASGEVSEAVAKKARNRTALLNDLDQAQMVVIQMVFWLTAVGILLGAYWADHSWGRWWAWDPKETWALILWIVYLVAIHLRMAVKRRGLVTAWLSVLGFFTMLWTHWGVNLLLSGLHSYA